MASSYQCSSTHSLFSVSFLQEDPISVHFCSEKALAFWDLGASPASSFYEMILKKIFITSCLRGFFLSIFLLSLPLHSASLVTEELADVVVLIENALTGSFRRRKTMRTSSPESYENAISCC